MTNKESLQTISGRTGYSVSTVSRVLSGKGEQYRISRHAIETITREARECNYTPDLIAKGLRTRKTNTIGLTVPSIDNPFFSNLASIITNSLRNHGYNIILADSMETEQLETDALDSFVSRKVDGIIALSAFGCGPDSIMVERISRAARKFNKPVLNLSIDEQTGEAGFITRIEAFTDMLFRKKRASIINKININENAKQESSAEKESQHR